MTEYIEREAAMLTPVLPKEHRHYQTSNLDDVYAQGWADALDNLKNAPVADVAPVVHGRWVTPHWHNGGYCYNCSECGGEAMHREYQWARNGIYPICPNCGAIMDGGLRPDDGD